MTNQLESLEIAVEAKLNKRPNCSQCNDHPNLVDHCQHCGGSGLEPINPHNPEQVKHE